MMKKDRRFGKKKNDSGFTIIELMIATLVFSTVLAMLTAGVIYFTNMYYKGMNLTNTQRITRAITDNISQAIQFSGGNIASGATEDGLQVICIGSKRYTFVPGRMVTKNGQPTSAGDDAGYRGLFVDTVQSGCNASMAALSATDFRSRQNISGAGLVSPLELLGSRMRLTHLSVDPAGVNTFNIQISVASGDEDLITSKIGYNVRCKSSAGSQYCATSKLTTTVVKRV